MPRLLVISGEPADLSWLRSAPSLRECEIEAIAGDAEALRLLRRRNFDVLLTDPCTPVAEDLAFIDEVRSLRPGLRTIVLTPEATTHELIAALRAHVFACFSAPFEAGDIVAMISRAIEASDWRDGIEVLSARPDWIALKVASRQLTAERLVRLMDELKSDLPDPEREALITAFREILLNAMEHGAGFNPELVVEVSAVRSQQAIIYYFRDPGPGFNREVLPHAAVSNAPDDPITHVEYRIEHGLRPGGFGILLSQQLVDELIYNERGNEVMLIKHIKNYGRK
jgi:anti-sigma regulatory factor (Ser/Thr protein kinase)/CheY-like chemotaxis protein